MNASNRIYKLTIRAILMAIIVLQVAIPFLGYIPVTPIISITTLHVTVIVTSIVLGTRDGIFVGFMWGFATFLRANFAPAAVVDRLIFTNPLISILPRMAVGLMAGWIFTVIYNKSKKTNLAAISSAIVGTITNTALVLGSMAIFYREAAAKSFNATPDTLLKALGGIVMINGVPELIFAILATPLITRALFAATKLKPEIRNQ